MLKKDKTFKLIFTALNQKVETRPSISQVRRGQPLNPAQMSIRWMVCYLVPIPYLFSSFTEWAKLQHLMVSQKIQIQSFHYLILKLVSFFQMAKTLSLVTCPGLRISKQTSECPGKFPVVVVITLNILGMKILVLCFFS